MNTKTSIIITSICTSAVLGLIYYLFLRKKPKNRNNTKKDSNVITNNEIEYSSVKKDRFQVVTTNISLNLNNKHENQITSIDKQETFNIIKTIEKEYSVKNDNNPATNRSINNNLENDMNITEKNKNAIPSINTNFRRLKLYDDRFEVKTIDDPSSLYKQNERKKMSKHNIKEATNVSNKFSNFHVKKTIENNNFENIQYKQFIQDLEVYDKNTDNPVVQITNNNLMDTNIIFESDGYIEESEDMNKEALVLSDNLSSNNRVEVIEEAKAETNADVTNKLIFENDKILINNRDELHEVLLGKLKFKEYNCKLTLIDKLVQNKEVSIVRDQEILVVLEYLYTELHPGLIELSDNFIQERRRYFKIDHETYINILNYFLRKKEEFFLCVLSDLMSKLNISQKALDNTFFYYMNVAPNSSEIEKIREAYDKVYHAGLKYSIVPKNLTKKKLYKVLKYQCDTYEKLVKQYPNYEIDIIEIIVTDHVYLEYGLDREAIKAAIKNFSIGEDDEFAKIKEKLDNFQNDSFINI